MYVYIHRGRVRDLGLEGLDEARDCHEDGTLHQVLLLQPPEYRYIYIYIDIYVMYIYYINIYIDIHEYIYVYIHVCVCVCV